MLTNSPSHRAEELAILQAIRENPGDETHYLVLADWLEEYDDPRRAELLRLHRRLLATCCEPERHPERLDWQTRVVELLSEGIRPCVPQQAVDLGGGVEMRFSFLPPGSFLMGSPPDEGRSAHELQHRVTLSQGFFLGVHQVTQAQWQAVMRRKPSRFKGDNRPVENVSWNDCQEFCKKLSQRDGKRYRLPTEAEWEYACRAGTTTPYCSGTGLEALRKVGWCGYAGKYGSAKEMKPVGQLQPNAWGLVDMHGNVWEWCQDWYGPYSHEDNKDQQGADSGDSRVLRGGSWCSNAVYCRAASRGRSEPAFRNGEFGLRVCFRPD
jgi:uncharacterized protein (TIGR02996 family)